MQDYNPWENILMSVAFAINSTVHVTAQMTPGQLVFGQDMILHTANVANWEHACLDKQNKIDYNDALEKKQGLLITTKLEIEFST